MAETGEQNWSRSRYPLQASSKKLVEEPTPPAATDASPVNASSSVRDSELPHGANTSLGWHGPDINTGSGAHSIKSNLENGTSLPSPEASQGPQTSLLSSTAVSPSIRASSPLSASYMYQLPSDKVDVIGYSPWSPHRNENRARNSLNFSSQTRYPLQNMADDIKEPQSPTSILDNGLDAEDAHTQKPATDGATERTLKRSMRSRPLRDVAAEQLDQMSISQVSPRHSTESNGAPASEHPLEEESIEALPSHFPKRQAYPLQSTMRDFAGQGSEEVLSTTESRMPNVAISHQNGDSRESVPSGPLATKQVCPMREFTSVSHHMPLPVRGLDSETQQIPQNSTAEPVEDGQPSMEALSLHREEYPLQKLAGHTLVSLVPSLSLSQETDQDNTKQNLTSQNSVDAHADQGVELLVPGAFPAQEAASTVNWMHSEARPSLWNADQNQPTKSSSSKAQQDSQAPRAAPNPYRKAYPLQSPASVLNLKDATPPQESTAQNDSVPEVGQKLDGTKPRTNSDRAKAIRRQAYPLQSPASLLDLKDSTGPGATPPKASTSIHANGQQSYAQEQTQSSENTNAFRRQKYPLHAPTSYAKPHSPPESPSAARGHGVTTDLDEPRIHNEERNPAGRDANRGRRPFYPLQSPASIPLLQLPPSPSPSPPPSAEREVPDKNQLSVNSARQKEIASQVINHWRRQVYPLQSPENASIFQRAPTPQPPEPEEKQNHHKGPVHLPKHLRAVKDAEKPGHGGRTIVVCLDGTGDKFDSDNSNIVHLISALKKDDPNQVTYYQAGIGTYTRSGLSTGFSAALDMAVGSELGLHVRDAYHFLMHTYKEGDKICIFGFSRGAYTARCLAGMVHKVGLLPPRNIQQIVFAYEFYTNDTQEGWEQSGSFKATFSINVSVHFLGCFDSVASVGFIPRQLPLSSTPGNKPRYFRHAMALDERRAKFKVCRHQIRDFGTNNQSASAFDDADEQGEMPASASRKRYGQQYHPNVTDEEYEILAEADEFFDTDVLEVWFAGAHADIGGGAVANDERHKLAQIPLRWMIRQTFECDTGIIFKTKKLAEFGLDVHTLWPRYSSLKAPSHGPPPSLLEKYDKALPPRSIRRSKLVSIDKVENGESFYHLKSHTDDDWTPEQVEDFYDAMSPLNDQLEQAPRWWILELWPVEYKVPIEPGVVETRTGMNLGRYRGVDDVEPKVHWTVLHRERHKSYRIQVRTAPHTKWVVAV